MTFARGAVRQFERMTRAHALLLTCACLAILSLAFASPRSNWTSFDWRGETSKPNEDAIDAGLREAAIDALGQREGTIIIMDPQSGRVRAIVNPQLASGQASMPGSTMKSFTALAALRAGLVDPNSRTVCPGRFTGLSLSLPCVHENHLPPFSPAQAIAYSCNYYFGTLGQRLGRDKLIETLRLFGFGQPTGVSGNEEATGTLRPCETGNSARIRAESDHASQQSDCAARTAVGESDHIQVTPIQLLAAYSALLNGGHLFQPRVAGTENFRPMERASISISPEERTIITEGMRGAVRYGTARSAHLDSLPVSILGKTGTSLPAKGFRTNGWFVGFASPDTPVSKSSEPAAGEIGLAVLVFLTRSHGSEAAAVSKSIFEEYAKAISRTESTASSDSTSPPVEPKSAIGNRQLAIGVHLVTENVTQELPLEGYVLGVMRAEGSMETEPEALKALAVAIRTYALKNRGRHAKDGYDFCSTTHCQRFLGRSPTVREGASDAKGALPDGWVSAAVRATEGQVLTSDNGQTIEAYFSASCGGETANIATLWGARPPDYLRGVRDEFCVTGAHANWTDMISRADLLRALQSDARTSVGSRLDNVVVSKRDETGRAEFIALEGDHRRTVRGWDFKIIVGRVLGWNLLKSSRFEVSRSGSNFIFRGSGFGHGLGLCQEGAHVMAQRGVSYMRILAKYFPGTSVRNADRIATGLNSQERWDLNAEDAEAIAEEHKGFPPRPLRNPLRSLRLNARFDYDTSRVWKADLLLATQRFNQVLVEIPQPGSGEIFIAHSPTLHRELRRSAMLCPDDNNRCSHYAHTELANLLKGSIYKHFVPAGLSTIAKFLTISSEHFRVTYPAGVDRRDADSVLKTLENARADFVHRASAASVSLGGLSTLQIRLNESTGDFTARTGQPWWAAAATRGKQIELQPVGVLKRRGALITTLRHELAHAVIDVVSHDRAPRWLEEGFAIYLAGEGSMLARYAPKTRLIPDEIEKRLERPGSQQEMRALYAAAYTSVVEMIRTGSEATVWKRLAGS